MVDDPTLAPPRPPRWRTVVAAVCAVVAVVGLLVSVVAVWAQRTVLDGDAVAGAVDNALDDPEVTDALAVYLTTELLDALGPTDALRARVEQGIADALADERVQQLLVGVTERAHTAVKAVILDEDGVDGVSVDGDTVTVNTLPVLAAGLRRLQDVGLFSNVVVPELRTDGDPAEQIGELGDAFGRSLPDDFGQLVVYEGDAVTRAGGFVSTVRGTVETVERWTTLAVVLTLLAAVAAVAVAPSRRRMLAWLALGAAVAMVGALVVVQVAAGQAPDAVAEPGARAAVVGVLDPLVGSLVTVLALVAGVAGLVGVGALVAGRRQP